MSKRTDFTKQKKKQDKDGSYMVSIGGKPFCRMYHEKSQYKKRKKRRKYLNKWQFLTKKARELRNQPTPAEVVFERKLKELGYDYKFQWQYLYKEFGGICDFYIRNRKVCIEIDGGYHLDEDQQQIDRVKDFVYSKMCKKPLRITNQQAMYLSIEQIKTLIDNCKRVKY